MEARSAPRPRAGRPRGGKTTPDAFHGTSLRDELTALSVDRLVIGGYASEFCVDTTTRRAAALGYPVTLIADGHTTHDKEHLSASAISAHHNVTLCDITSFGVRIEARSAADLKFGASLRGSTR